MDYHEFVMKENPNKVDLAKLVNDRVKKEVEKELEIEKMKLKSTLRIFEKELELLSYKVELIERKQESLSIAWKVFKI